MKNKLSKKFFTFILLASGMFSFSFVNAQTCNGNKVWACRTCNGPFGTTYQECDCVNQSQVATWQATPCGNVPPDNNGNHGNGNNGNNGGGGCICRFSNSGTGESSGSIYPNPLSNSTSIYFSLVETQNVSLRIYGVNGKLVETLADGEFEDGEHHVIWNVANINAGIYFLRLETASYSENKKLIVTK